jgi:hypothetical protein
LENPEVKQSIKKNNPTPILDEMQPLYFFNMKSNKESDSLSSIEDRRLAVKEASTPCFIGSPVNATSK